MVNKQASFIVCVLIFYGLFSMILYKLMAEPDDQTRKVYIVYLGEKKYDDVKLTTESHHNLLATILESKEKSVESMVYSYRHGFSGFAAKLTKFEAQKLSEMHGVVRVFPNSIYKTQTTRSWDFLELSSSFSPSNNLLYRGKMGENIIIGVIDTGIWPESEAFNDKELGDIPSRWKGICESGVEFNSTNCNKKIISARSFSNGFMASFGQEALAKEYLSPRDFNGHGTHVASTAAGSFVANVSYFGSDVGTVRGGAPLARLAIYKVLWGTNALGTAGDILAAIDAAIHDGVDILSMSIQALNIPLFPEFNERNEIAIGSFHAIARGIHVVSVGGNFGPNQQTVVNTAPWILTVAASTTDRAFLSSITLLGDNTTYFGHSLFQSKKDVVVELALSSTRRCDEVSRNSSSMSGKVVLCFSDVADALTTSNVGTALSKANGSGIIVAGQYDNNLFPCRELFPCIRVDTHIGTKLHFYALAHSKPMIRIGRTKTIIGKPISTRIAYFSSRGPNSASPAILKPDIAAPGSNIIAAISPRHVFNDKGFGMMSGTSMAAPHIAGIVALLKSLHPTWSPAAIKSALITTGRENDPSGLPIFTDSSPPKVGDPFDYGGGVVDPNAAADPGLVYDLNIRDYIHYLCGMGYMDSDIHRLTQQKTKCPLRRPSVLDLNLPTITIPALTNSTTVTRTVTNVGNLTSVYRAVIKAPLGTKVSVRPRVLAFTSKVKKISFKVTISTTIQRNYGYSFGSLIWSDRLHFVKSPLSVKIDFL